MQPTNAPTREPRKAKAERAQYVLDLLQRNFPKVHAFTRWQIRVNDSLDIYPVRRRFHDIRLNERGTYESEKTLVAFVKTQLTKVEVCIDLGTIVQVPNRIYYGLREQVDHDKMVPATAIVAMQTHAPFHTFSKFQAAPLLLYTAEEARVWANMFPQALEVVPLLLVEVIDEPTK